MNNRYFFGILIVMAGGTFLSTSGILLRIMDSPNGWQIIFYRSLTFFIFIFLLLLFKYGKGTLHAYRAIGFRGFVASWLLGLGSVCYIFAMLNTTVANVVFIIGSAPLVTALMAWLILREKVSGWSLIAMFTALLGIGLMFLDGLVSGGMLGNLLALVMVFMFAFYLLILRYQKNVDMIPATGLSGLITLSLAAMFMPTFEINTHDLIICIALGSFQFGLGFLLLTLGTRYIPAAEVALFAMTESILNPIWVWIGVNEVPSNYTLAGSAIVLLSVIGYSFIVIRAEHRQSGTN